jgi:hypothetical protein
MTKKRTIGLIAGLVLLAGTSGLVMAEGFGGHGGEHGTWMLARAAGLTHSQIASAFSNDANLVIDRTSLKTAHDAMMTCLVSGNDCSSQIASFSKALQTMAQERMTVWQGLFKSANPKNLQLAASVYSQLQALYAQKQQILQSALGAQSSEAAPIETPSE